VTGPQATKPTNTLTTRLLDEIAHGINAVREFARAAIAQLTADLAALRETVERLTEIIDAQRKLDLDLQKEIGALRRRVRDVEDRIDRKRIE
jgi:hypothetical protein